MPVEKLSNGTWFARTPDGFAKGFKTRDEGREWLKDPQEPTHKWDKRDDNTIRLITMVTVPENPPKLWTPDGFPSAPDLEYTPTRTPSQASSRPYTTEELLEQAADKVPPIHTQIIRALESGVFNHSNIKAKNPDTGKVVKMTLGSGNRAYVAGIKAESIQDAMPLFSVKAREIGATVLEWVKR